MIKFLFKYSFTAVAAIVLFSSCKKTFDLKPINELDESQVYLTVADADAAVIGVYGKFQALAERYILLNELRADMVNYTMNADENLRQLSTHSVTTDNPYASPRPFYEFILNCNDVLKNFDIMRQNNRLRVAEYDQRYSDVACLRSFIYLQLGIHYGEVPYVTDALESVDAIKNIGLLPKLPFNTLLDSLINFTERLPHKEIYPAGPLIVSVDGYPTAKFFIPKKVLLGDLNLWRGNYVQAATWYRQVMETATPLGSGVGARYYMQYKLGWNTSNEDHYISYSRVNDANSLVTEGSQWRYMFERSYDNGFDYEWIWVIPFDNRFKPENPFVKLFSPIGGSYLLKPSGAAMEMWSSQTQKSGSGTGPGLPYDARGQLSWKNIGGQPVVMKYLYNYIVNSTNTPINPLVKNSKWFLFRQTHLHLRFAEAANRANRPRLASAFVNNGLQAAFPAPTSNVTNYEGTHAQSVFADTYPFDFDAREGNAPFFRADWYRHLGIRSRANLLNLPIIATTVADSVLQLENGIIQEVGLENGFEGTRWPDLLRIALRRNDPAFLADKIFNKLQKDGVPDAAGARTRLMNKANWYLPFKM